MAIDVNGKNDAREIIHTMHSLKAINKQLSDALNEYSLKRKIQLRTISKHSCPECGASPIIEIENHAEGCSFKNALNETVSMSEENQALLSKLVGSP